MTIKTSLLANVVLQGGSFSETVRNRLTSSTPSVSSESSKTLSMISLSTSCWANTAILPASEYSSLLLGIDVF